MKISKLVPFLCLLTAGCDLSALQLGEEKDSKSEKASGPFLTPSYFAGRLTASLDAIGVEEEIQEDYEFFANEPETDTDTDECYDKLEQVIVFSTDTQLTVGADIDIADCLDKSAKDFDWETARIRFYMTYDCSSGGLAKYNDSKWGDVPETPCPQAEGTRIQLLLNTELDFRGTGTEGGKPYKYKAVNANLISTDAGESCSAEFKGGVWVQADGCIQRKLNGEDDGTANFIVNSYSGKSLTYTDNDLFFRTGVIDFTINDWKGSMTYSGADTAPSFTVANSKDSFTGTFEYNKFSKGPEAQSAPTAPTASEEAPAEPDSATTIDPASDPVPPEPEPLSLRSRDDLRQSAKDAARKAATKFRNR